MNRHQKKVLSLAAAIANLSFTMAVAGVATYAWFSANRPVEANGIAVQTSIPGSSLRWEILKYNENIKSGKSYDKANEFFLQEYDGYLTQKNQFTNCILVATVDLENFTKSSNQIYIDITCANNDAPVYGATDPEYTSNICQFKVTAVSYKTGGASQALNTEITTTTDSLKYSTATTYFSTKNDGEKFLSIISDTPYKRSNKITLVPDLTDLPAGNITELVFYVECSYHPQLMDYFLERNHIYVGSSSLSVEGDIDMIDFRLGNVYSGSYVKVTGTVADLQTTDYLIVEDTNSIALDGSLESFTGHNYFDVYKAKNRIRNTENTYNSRFNYNQSTDKLTSASDKVIGNSSGNVDVGSYTNSASVSSGVASIRSGSRPLGFDSTENVTKFKYANSLSSISAYKYNASAPMIYLNSISLNTSGVTTTFNRYDNFSSAGLVVTATFTDSSTADVTNECVLTIGGEVVNQLTILQNTGSQTVTVTYTDPDNHAISDSKTYTITVNAQSLSINHDTLDGYVGVGGGSLTVTAQHFTGVISYVWSSSNTSVATVSGSGTSATVTYVGEGTATIYCVATSNSQSATASCTVNVETYVAVTGVTVSPASVTLDIGHTQQLTPSVSPSGASNQSVTYSSSNTSKATVSNSGLITAVAAGSATITVTTVDGNFQATCSVTINDPTVVSTLEFTAKCNGSGTADNGVTWTVTSDAAESNFDSNRGIHYGTNNASVSYIQLSTSGISGTVTSIVINASGNNTPTLSVTVGGNAFGTSQTLTTTNASYTFTGTETAGQIIIRNAKASKQNGALYIKSVVVTYTPS